VRARRVKHADGASRRVEIKVAGNAIAVLTAEPRAKDAVLAAAMRPDPHDPAMPLRQLGLISG
jgi:hypothetical protein